VPGGQGLGPQMSLSQILITVLEGMLLALIPGFNCSNLRALM